MKVREETRRPPASATPSVRVPGSTEPGTNARGIAATVGEVAETAGAGAGAVVAVLAPVLAGTAAAIFLLVGYVLRMLDPGAAFARTMLTRVGVTRGDGVAVLVAAGWACCSPRCRNKPSALGGRTATRRGGDPGQGRLVARPMCWKRGLPCVLRDALTDPATATALQHTAPPRRRTYPSPGVRPPAGASPARRREGPRHTAELLSPTTHSPDFGGPEHQPE
ncbi:membrane protein [Streptomyces heliomycini]